MRTQEEINYYFQSFAIKSAIELVKIESILEVNKVQLPNNIIIHKNGIDVAKFLNWWQNKSNYPKTYEECCSIAGGIDSARHLQYDTRPSYKFEEDLRDLLESLRKLIICRDAYWKIAGEQMGLGKPWKPEFGKYIHYNINFYLFKGSFLLYKGKYMDSDNRILVFPTEEMRDAFYENFKDLIEKCKELL